jgi:hypothetical protein
MDSNFRREKTPSCHVQACRRDHQCLVLGID